MLVRVRLCIIGHLLKSEMWGLRLGFAVPSRGLCLNLPLDSPRLDNCDLNNSELRALRLGTKIQLYLEIVGTVGEKENVEGIYLCRGKCITL